MQLPSNPVFKCAKGQDYTTYERSTPDRRLLWYVVVERLTIIFCETVSGIKSFDI